MRKNYLVLLIAVLYFSCSPNVAKIDNSLKKYFDSEGVNGTFALFDNQRGDVTVYNMKMDTQRFTPGGIFKIAETLIGIETSRLTGENSKMRGVDSGLAGLTLKAAFDENNYAYFDALAKNIGLDTMKFWIDSLHYGNTQISQIDSFWRDGELKISSDEQLGLVNKLYFDKLPFQKYAQQVLRDLMLKEDNTLYKFSYATGTAGEGENQIGWIAGWIEENRHVYFFSSVVSSREGTKDLERVTLKITKDILLSKGFFKGEN